MPKITGKWLQPSDPPSGCFQLPVSYRPLLMILLHGQMIAEWMHVPDRSDVRHTKSYILVPTGIPFIIGYNVHAYPGDCIQNASLHNVSMYHQHRSRFYISRVFPSRSHRAAIATVTAQGSFCHRTLFPSPKGFHFEFTRRDIRLNGVLSKRITALGAPIALQDALINVSFLIITVIQ